MWPSSCDIIISNVLHHQLLCLHQSLHRCVILRGLCAAAFAETKESVMWSQSEYYPIVWSSCIPVMLTLKSHLNITDVFMWIYVTDECIKMPVLLLYKCPCRSSSYRSNISWIVNHSGIEVWGLKKIISFVNNFVIWNHNRSLRFIFLVLWWLVISLIITAVI